MSSPKPPVLFAAGTTVPVDRSRLEIERMLVKYGASAFAISWSNSQASIGFTFHGWAVRFDLAYPDPAEHRYVRRALAEQTRAYDAELRRLWRAFAILIKAKLDCVLSGITTFEKEFLAHLIIPGSEQTVAQSAIPRLVAARASAQANPEPLPQLPEL